MILKNYQLNRQKGQAILILLGAIALGLTLGLAVASRSTTDVQISRQLEESSKAFSGAEAGVEDVLRTPLPAGTTSRQLNFAGTAVNVQAQPTPAGGAIVEYPDWISSGDTLTVWFTDHETNLPYNLIEADNYGPVNPNDQQPQMSVCWTGQTPGSNPGLEVAVAYRDSAGNYQTVRRAYQKKDPPIIPCQNGVGNGNCFENVSGQTCNGSKFIYPFKKTLSFNPNGTFDVDLTRNNTAGNVKLYMRLKPYSDKVKIGIDPSGQFVLPQQALVDVASQGKSSSGQTTKIQIFKSFPVPPPIFDYTLYSGTGITVGN